MTSFNTRRGSLVIVAVLLLALLAYLATRLLGPERQQSTDDAYVHADYSLVAPKIAGFVTQVLVEDNQRVQAGQVLARIDERDYRAALAAAEADVIAAEARHRHVAADLERQQAVIAQSAAQVDADQAAFTFARQELERYQHLASQGAGTLQNAQQSRSRVDASRAVLEKDKASALATRKQLDVLQAQQAEALGALKRGQAQLEQAQLNLSYCEIRAPFDGMVGRRAVRVGAYTTPGTALLAVVPLQNAYVVANFQETQLTDVQPGQAVDVRVDTFPGQTLRGHVDSIAPATGLSFSPIAPDNATGNFTKIVQRIPVKIVLDADQPLRDKLRVGMSVVARIDTQGTARREQVADR
ncbi:MAG: putative multidrug resistance protein EmrK [Stenotrophomonas maltophilia]|nr:MAG: putative multidrug resistance protein EmrK [Stenotrophomonas maltophilia]